MLSGCSFLLLVTYVNRNSNTNAINTIKYIYTKECELKRLQHKSIPSISSLKALEKQNKKELNNESITQTTVRQHNCTQPINVTKYQNSDKKIRILLDKPYIIYT